MSDRLISPELALVDPELSFAARRLLPAPGCFVPGSMGGAPRSAPGAAPGRSPASAPAWRPPHWSDRRSLGATAVVLAAAAAFVILALAGAPERREAPSAPQPAGAPHDAGAARPSTWPAVPGARAYRVKLERNGALVYEASSPRTTLELPRGMRLAPGHYTWSVTVEPEQGAEPSQRPVVESSFDIPARTRASS